MQVLTTAPSPPHRYVSFSELEARAADERAARQAAEAAAAEAAAARAAVRALAVASLEQASNELAELQMFIDEAHAQLALQGDDEIDEAHAQLALQGDDEIDEAHAQLALQGEAATIAQAVCDVSSGAVTSTCMLGLAAEPPAGTPPLPLAHAPDVRVELPSMQALTTAPPDVRVELPSMQALTTAPPDVRVELPSMQALTTAPPDVRVELQLARAMRQLTPQPAHPPADPSAHEAQHASARYGALEAQLALAQSRCARRSLPTGPRG
jgi:hypothetical protein